MNSYEALAILYHGDSGIKVSVIQEAKKQLEKDLKILTILKKHIVNDDGYMYVDFNISYPDFEKEEELLVRKWLENE